MRYDFQLTTVSDVFVGGANSKEADLKPSTIANGMRFWFRAMMGAVIGNDMAALKKLETIAFGSTDVCSSFTLRLRGNWSYSTLGEATDEWLGYFYLAHSVKEREYIPPGETFLVSLDFRIQDRRICNVVSGALWLLVHFGGIGSRSRRTFGSLAARLVEGQSPLPFELSGDVVGHYHDAMSAILGMYRDFASLLGPLPQDAKLPDHASFRRFSCRVVTSPEWSTVFSLQEHTGRLLRGFRNGTTKSIHPAKLSYPHDWKTKTRDYVDVVSPFLSQRPAPSPGDLTNDVLGLPIVTISSSRKQQGRRPWQASTQWQPPDGKRNEWNDRRASPLFLHPIKVGTDRYALVMTVFFAPFLPDRSRMRIKTDRDEHPIEPIPTSHDIETMAMDLFTFTRKWYPSCKEVKLIDPARPAKP